MTKTLHLSAVGNSEFIRPSINKVEFNRSVQPQESNKLSRIFRVDIEVKNQGSGKSIGKQVDNKRTQVKID